MEAAKTKWWQALDATALKLIAIAAMLFDHSGKLLFPSQTWMVMVGRLTFPIMAFFIAEGAKKTRNREKYLLRLLAFALIAEVPFDLMITGRVFYLGYQNVIFTLAMGLLCCTLADNVRKRENFLTNLALLVLVMFSAAYMKVDYDMTGVLLVLLFYLFSDVPGGIIFAMLIGNGLICLRYNSDIQIFAFAAIPLLYMYNGRRGTGMKYLFYVFYPLHQLILWYIAYYL